MKANGFTALVAAVVDDHTKDWERSADITSDVHPALYEASIRYLVGDEVWAAIGRQIVPIFHQIVDVVDLKRVALSHTPASRLMKEYHSARRLHRLLRKAFEPRLAASSPAVQAIVLAQLTSDRLTVRDRPWMLMYLLWNAVMYSGSYAMWTLADILSRPELRERVETAATPRERNGLITHCMYETIRLYPLTIFVRGLSRPFDYDDGDRTHHVPAGNMVGILVPELTKDPEAFPRPEQYDPDRYSNGEAGHPGDFYGKGPFGCVAQAFSRALVTNVIQRLFERFEMTLLDPLPQRHTRVHLNNPTEPMPFTIRPRKSLVPPTGRRP
ncbi:hypothetical protein GCM10027589_30210 [Actinocorallia lasiicapitis]